MTEQVLSLIYTTATENGLDVNLVRAVVTKESSGSPWAMNPEPRYRYLWDVKKNAPFRKLTEEEIASEVPPRDFPCLYGDADQEWWGQAASWGLMQVMGAVAREYGFKGLFLSELCDPQAGLTYGCKHLAALLKRFKGDMTKALSTYNTGSPMSPVGAAYAGSVLKIMAQLTKV